jgi:small conductance mechanosensitive channel
MILENLVSKVPELPAFLTFETLITAFLVLAAGYLLNKASNFLVQKLADRRKMSRHGVTSIKKLTGYVIYPLTGVALLGVFGVPLSALGTAVGLIGLGISFALKDIIANFISGILIMIYRPIEIGDQVEVGGEGGTVQDIKTRSTEIKTYDGREVIVPNSNLYNSQIINNTAYSKRRFEVLVGVGYEEDIQEAKELAEETLDEAENVEEEPETQVLVNELGGSSVDLKLRGWSETEKASQVKAASEVTQLIKEKYDDAGIDIPYPIRTVYMEE